MSKDVLRKVSVHDTAGIDRSYRLCLVNVPDSENRGFEGSLSVFRKEEDETSSSHMMPLCR